MADKIIRGASTSGAIRIMMADTTELVGIAAKMHKTYPIATAALGRLLTAAAIMGYMLKSPHDTITLQIKGDGPLGGVMAVGNAKAQVKGYVVNPGVVLPSKIPGKLNVGDAVGKGALAVIRDFGLKEPYVAHMPLVSGEIAEDLTSYYATSEQVPTSVALGVFIDTDGSVLHSGGFILQLMPEATEEDALLLERNLAKLPPITTMLKDGMSCEDVVFAATQGFDMLVYHKEQIEPHYVCDCNRDRVERALISLGTKELSDLITEQGNAELTCQFCDKVYQFDQPALESLLKECY